MKIEARKARATVTLALDEDEAVWLAQLAGSVQGDGPPARFTQAFFTELLEALGKVGVAVPRPAESFRVSKGKLWALPLPRAAEDAAGKDDPADPPEPVAGKAPRFV